MNDLEQVLVDAGIEWRRGKMDCPECGERKVTASTSKGIAKCWGCEAFWSVSTSTPEYKAQEWAPWLIGQIASLSRTHLTEKTTTYDWLTLKRRLPEDLDWLRAQDLGALDTKVDYKFIAKQASIKLEAAAQEGLKAAALLTKGKAEAITKATDLYTAEREALAHLTQNVIPLLSNPSWGEAVVYIYRDAHGQPVSLNIRKFSSEPETRKVMRVQPYSDRRGVFAPSETSGQGWGEDAPELLVVEGEHNLLSLRAAIRQWGPQYQIPALAVGGKFGADIDTIKDLAGDSEVTVVYDFDKVDPETGKPGGYALVEDLRKKMYLRARSTGPKAKDLDDFLGVDASRDTFRDEVLRRGKRVFIPFPILAAQVDAISTFKDLAPRIRSRVIQEFVIEHTRRRAQIYSIDGYAAIVTRDEESNVTEIIPARKGNPDFLGYLGQFGLTPADKYIDEIGACFGVIAADLDTPRNTIHSLSHYDGTTLYLNTYDGWMLRISPGSVVQRVPNGTDDVLVQQFSSGPNDRHASVKPWMPPMQEMKELLSTFDDPGLRHREGDLIDQHILSLVEYEGNTKMIKQLLKCWLLSLFFASSSRSKPIPMFEGSGNGGKSTVAARIGELIIGPKFSVTQMPSDGGKLAELMTGTPYIVFDEWDTPSKDVETGIKHLTTGGKHKRRELYTTANVVELSCDASVVITTNAIPLRQEASARRFLMVRVAARQKQIGDKVFQSVGAHLLPAFMQVRPQLWALLVRDLTACVDALNSTDPATRTSFSMSDFGSWVNRIAAHEGWEEDADQMFAATAHQQEDQAASSNMILRLLGEHFATSDGQAGKFLRASEWINLLMPLLGEHDREGRAKLTTHYFGYVAKVNKTLLEHQMGMAVQIDKHNKATLYAFTPKPSKEA
jgi:hypothetical protein